MRPNQISYKVTGRYALFTDPVTKIGGEKFSLMIPTYQALKGITESIYWKPSIIWYIDAVRVMNPIKTESKGIRTIKYRDSKKNDLSIYTYLSQVEYHVKAHFEFNKNRSDLQQDFNENKHYQIAKRCVEKGGRRDIYLGARECQGYVEPVEFGSEKGHYDEKEEISFGIQYHSISYPDENGKNKLIVKFWNPVMKNGVIEFCRPDECKIEREIRKQDAKTFVLNRNFTAIDEEKDL